MSQPACASSPSASPLASPLVVQGRPPRRDGKRYLAPWTYDEATEAFNLNPTRDLKSTRTTNLAVDTKPGALPLEQQRMQRCEQLRQYFHATCELFEKIFEHILGDEAYLVPPIHKLRHPLVFYLGHTATFYINKLAVAGLTQRINPKYEEMFATGVDEMSWDDLNDAHYSWPAIADVWSYRSQVRQRVDRMFDKYSKSGGGEGCPLPLTMDNSTDDESHTFFWAVIMGIEHERIHIETASVHLRELPMKYVVSGGAFWAPFPSLDEASRGAVIPAGAAVEGKDFPRNEFVPVLEAKVDVPVGRPLNSPFYGWDADYSAQGYMLPVEPFQASKYLVSNGEFYKFVMDGGYTQEKWWDEEGWKWVSWKKPQHPWFWVKQQQQGASAGASETTFKLRVQTDEIPLPWNWPVETNHLEARAYCNWLAAKTGKKKLRLPTEREWLVMWDKYISVDQGDWKVGANAPGNVNFDHQWASSCPVDKFQHGPLFDVVGNAWQHLETPVYPYKGYRPHPLYDDFSLPTMDGRHITMRGGCWISTGNEATRDARFAFRRHFFQCIGIRVVEGVDVDESKLLTSVLGMDPLVDMAAQKAFFAPKGEAEKEHYGARVAALALAAYSDAQLCKKKAPARALELQCGAARITFELAKTVDDCIGTDFTARNLQAAYSMRERATAAYSVVANAITKERKGAIAHGPDFSFNDRREHACFYQSDPANLHAHLSDFDLIVGFDTLSHSYRPRTVPGHAVSRLSQQRGGVVVLFEPREAGMSAVTDETLASVQKQQRPASCEVADMLRAAGAKVLPPKAVSFDVYDGIVAPDRVGLTRLTLDMIVAIVQPGADAAAAAAATQ